MTTNKFIYFILSAFIAGIIVLIFIQYNSAKNINNLINGNEKLLQELKVSNMLRELERGILSSESKIRGVIVANDSVFFAGVDSQIAEAQRYLDSLRIISDHDSTTKNINRLSALASEKLAFKNLILDSLRAGGNLSSRGFRAIMERRKLSNEVNFLCRKIYDSRKRLLDSFALSISNSGRNARQLGMTMIIVALGIAAGLFWYIISRVRRQNQLIQQLDASEKKVREASIVKENFIANISHEIRTPMNAILGFTNLLHNKNKDPELSEFVESIRKSGENLLTIINDVLDLSKIEAGMMTIESTPFSIRGLMHSIQTLFTEKLNEKKLQLSVVIEDSIPDTLSGDATRLSQILVNMIGNAIKFTGEGAIHIEVKNHGQSDNQVRIGFVISDTGIGIAKEKLPFVFERFQQAEDSITRKYGGTGLGLSIAKDLVLLQHGEIGVDSEPGKGSSFWFILPYDIPVGMMNVENPAETLGFDIPGAQYARILVAEDNEMNQNLIRHLLTDWNLSFDMVNNGYEAIESLQKKTYDLVLMDVQMPGMDGCTATQEIRKLKMDIPVIAMTAHAFAGEREKCLSYGMNEYISKPINQKELYRLIAQFTGIANGQRKEYNGETINQGTTTYQFINLEYMRDISGGDKVYERTVTAQFIEAIPLDVEALESALKNKDVDSIRKTAHNMKTNISVMGLTEMLQSYLDEMEYEDFDEAHFCKMISTIKTTCINALTEARHFSTTL